jgi:hypothetical protein
MVVFCSLRLNGLYISAFSIAVESLRVAIGDVYAHSVGGTNFCQQLKLGVPYWKK